MNKQHILEEIQRTTRENGGTSLGRQKFFTETGIKVSDWYGKHWIRWSDALREAKLTPNQFNKAYNKDVLIERLALLAKELGRFPLEGDLRMKAREDDKFPSHSTFERLGSKNQRILRVREWCQGRDRFEDVLSLCGESQGSKKIGLESSGIDHKNSEATGSVYLLRSGKFYKIGRSNAFGRREYELAIHLPEEAGIVHAIRTDDPIGIEAYWHERFKEQRQRKNCEWFALRTEDVQAFKRRKLM